MFGPEAPPLPWDSRNEYSRGSIELYYLSYAGEWAPTALYNPFSSASRCSTPLLSTAWFFSIKTLNPTPLPGRPLDRVQLELAMQGKWPEGTNDTGPQR